MSLQQSPQFLDVLDYSSQLLQDLNQRLSESTLWVRDHAFHQPISIEVQETEAAITLQAQFYTHTHSLAVRVSPEAVLIQGKRWEPLYRSAPFDLELPLCCFQRLIVLPQRIQPESAIAAFSGNQLTVTLWKPYPVRQQVTIGDQEVTVGSRGKAIES